MAQYACIVLLVFHSGAHLVASLPMHLSPLPMVACLDACRSFEPCPMLECFDPVHACEGTGIARLGLGSEQLKGLLGLDCSIADGSLFYDGLFVDVLAAH